MSIRETGRQRGAPRLRGPQDSGPGEDSASSGPGDGRGPLPATERTRRTPPRAESKLGGTTKRPRSRPNHGTGALFDWKRRAPGSRRTANHADRKTGRAEPGGISGGVVSSVPSRRARGVIWKRPSRHVQANKTGADGKRRSGQGPVCLFPESQGLFAVAHRRGVIWKRPIVSTCPVIASQCAHWRGNPFLLFMGTKGRWYFSCVAKKSTQKKAKQGGLPLMNPPFGTLVPASLSRFACSRRPASLRLRADPGRAMPSLGSAHPLRSIRAVHDGSALSLTGAWKLCRVESLTDRPSAA